MNSLLDYFNTVRPGRRGLFRNLDSDWEIKIRKIISRNLERKQESSSPTSVYTDTGVCTRA